MLFEKDLPDVAESSNIAIFEDDKKLSKNFSTYEDASRLQSNLDRVNSWAKANGMVYNKGKYKAMQLTRKHCPTPGTYILDGDSTFYCRLVSPVGKAPVCCAGGLGFVSSRIRTLNRRPSSKILA